MADNATGALGVKFSYNRRCHDPVISDIFKESLQQIADVLQTFVSLGYDLDT